MIEENTSDSLENRLHTLSLQDKLPENLKLSKIHFPLHYQGAWFASTNPYDTNDHIKDFEERYNLELLGIYSPEKLAEYVSEGYLPKRVVCITATPGQEPENKMYESLFNGVRSFFEQLGIPVVDVCSVNYEEDHKILDEQLRLIPVDVPFNQYKP